MAQFVALFLAGLLFPRPTNGGIQSNAIDPSCLGRRLAIVTFGGMPKLKDNLLKEIFAIMGREGKSAYDLQQQTLVLGQPIVKASVFQSAIQNT